MKHLDDNDVRERAFLIWKQAGEPSGKMAEFWYEAERQLEQERLKELGAAGELPRILASPSSAPRPAVRRHTEDLRSPDRSASAD
ncbi:DUF2934 domain-containing protein [Bradyrhizobium sp. WSM2793]|uniref:DUF2934 domain-containing protein n=1 Tax=Bradyrhizobium sp. WSM2793 TaxID=1038866 RepID=UPI00036BC2C3